MLPPPKKRETVSNVPNSGKGMRRDYITESEFKKGGKRKVELVKVLTRLWVKHCQKGTREENCCENEHGLNFRGGSKGSINVKL